MRIVFLDNIWFTEESKGYIPLLAIEVELFEDLTKVLDRFFNFQKDLWDNPKYISFH
ncbi:MAG: hypothetical protein ACW981_17550 [Candidatus Hodarchaeales archaeon]|jgi:hypothetical protein